jgi:transglutaminase-like putative cysteine protease
MNTQHAFARLSIRKTAFAAAVLFMGVVMAAIAAPAQREDWSVIKIAGIPVGYVHESWAPPGPGGLLTSASDMKMVLNRLGNRVEIELRSSSEETPDGRLRKTAYEMRASVLSTKTEAVIKEGVIEFRSEAGGKTYTRTLEYSGEILGPEGIRRLSESRLKAPGDAVEFQTFAAEAGAATKGSRKVLGRESVLISGREIAALKVEEYLEVAGVKSTAWLDDRFETVKAEMPTPFGPSEIVRTDRETALAAAGEAELPSELYTRSILRTNVRLPQARAIEYLKVKLTLRNPEAGWPEILGSHQAVTAKTPEVLTLEVQRPPVPKPSTRPAPMTEANREFLVPNEFIQSDLPEIRKAALDIAGGEADAFKAALKLVRWVAENMTFDLGIALAPAAELFQNRRGTCLGYATLLATLARAAGIPSRVVMGYVYVLGMFGGHAWTEILAGDVWVPLDATIVAPGVADAARIAFGASSLLEGAGGLSSGAAQRLFGQVDVAISEYAVGGRGKVVVPEKAKPYEIEGEVYRNPGLGFSVAKPEGFAFAKMDAVWPDPAVVALEGPDGGRVEIRELYLLPWKEFGSAAEDLFTRLGLGAKSSPGKAGGLTGLAASGTAKAALVLRDGSAAWLVLAEGPNAAVLLDRTARGLAFK